MASIQAHSETQGLIKAAIFFGLMQVMKYLADAMLMNGAALALLTKTWMHVSLFRLPLDCRFGIKTARWELRKPPMRATEPT